MRDLRVRMVTDTKHYGSCNSKGEQSRNSSIGEIQGSGKVLVRSKLFAPRIDSLLCVILKDT